MSETITTDQALCKVCGTAVPDESGPGYIGFRMLEDLDLEVPYEVAYIHYRGCLEDDKEAIKAAVEKYLLGNFGADGWIKIEVTITNEIDFQVYAEYPGETDLECRSFHVSGEIFDLE